MIANLCILLLSILALHSLICTAFVPSFRPATNSLLKNAFRMSSKEVPVTSGKAKVQASDAAPKAPSTAAAPTDMSSIKEGMLAPVNLNGSDVRVGIIMARWNADVIQGLYKVLK